MPITTNPISEADTAAIEAIAEQLGLAMSNLQLRETLRSQSIRDPLTGLFNRRYLEKTSRANCSGANAVACRCRC